MTIMNRPSAVVTILAKWSRLDARALCGVASKWAKAAHEVKPTKNISYLVSGGAKLAGLRVKEAEASPNVYAYEGRQDGLELPMLLEKLAPGAGMGEIEGWCEPSPSWLPSRFEWLAEWREAMPQMQGSAGHSVALHVRKPVALNAPSDWTRAKCVELLTLADEGSPLSCGIIDIAPPSETADGLHYLHRRQGTLCREANQWWAWKNRERLEHISIGIGWGTVLSRQLVERCGGLEVVRQGVRSEGAFSHRTDLVQILPSGACLVFLSPSLEDPLTTSYSKPGSPLVLDWRDVAPRALWLRRTLASIGAL
jgi:hypothetical protein